MKKRTSKTDERLMTNFVTLLIEVPFDDKDSKSGSAEVEELFQ